MGDGAVGMMIVDEDLATSNLSQPYFFRASHSFRTVLRASFDIAAISARESGWYRQIRS
jgi:hypothetical protein